MGKRRRNKHMILGKKGSRIDRFLVKRKSVGKQILMTKDKSEDLKKLEEWNQDYWNKGLD